MEPKRIPQVCSKCHHVQMVRYWGQTTWQCSAYKCKRYNDIKVDIIMKPIDISEIPISGVKA